MSLLHVYSAAGRSADARRPDHDGLSEKRTHQLYVASNIRDINPVDYAISGALQQRVYHQRQFKTVDELQRAIVTEWQKLSQRSIDNSINE